MKSQDTRNYALDLLKGIGCIGVVFMHVTFPGKAGGVIHKFAEFSVPVFIMISGYYAYGCDRKKIKRRLLKIIKIFVFAFVLYSVYRMVGLISEHKLLDIIDTRYLFGQTIKLIVFCTIDYAIPLWYLIAMIETYMLWLIIGEHLYKKHIVVLMILLFVLQVVSRILCETMALPWYLKICFLTCALPWFLFGYYMRMPVEKIIDRFSDSAIITIAVVGCIIAVIPVLIDTSIQFSFFGVVLYSISLFVLAIRHGNNSICSVMEYIGNRLSLNIYVLHALIGGALWFACNKTHVIGTFSALYLWGRPIATVVISLCVAWFIERLKCIKHIKKIAT